MNNKSNYEIKGLDSVSHIVKTKILVTTICMKCNFVHYYCAELVSCKKCGFRYKINSTNTTCQKCGNIRFICHCKKCDEPNPVLLDDFLETANETINTIQIQAISEYLKQYGLTLYENA